MRIAVSLSVLCLAAALPARAEVKASVKVGSYPVAGQTGEALIASMDRNGPRHGFMTRAIAQTRYEVSWRLDWRITGKVCRLKAAHADLAIDYSYPKLSSPVSPALARRWNAFLAGVRKHEQTHGRYARDMVNTAYRKVNGVTVANDPACSRAKRQVEKIVADTYAAYEARQLAFDQREHSTGGTVDRLITALLKRR